MLFLGTAAGRWELTSISWLLCLFVVSRHLASQRWVLYVHLHMFTFTEERGEAEAGTA